MQQHRLSRDEWWTSVRAALDHLDSEQVASYQAESRCLDAAAADGLDREAIDETLKNPLEV
ncbi:hypothetical protein [Candidatus Poriferisodalis sp.]|uniref:hypothetical protein n=1 Tax=Candidatus Poriferisodalis sp. TaxID=3101277 RepID=UPI003B028F77